MKIKSIIRGFTLIELLVVITIIGILATGGIAIFTKQLQGARDSTRISDIKLLQSSAEMYYSDNDSYPTLATFSGALKGYMTKKITDPKYGLGVCWNATTSNQICNGYYDVGDDSFNLPLSSMKLGIIFEKEENKNNLASDSGVKGDGGNVNYVYEIFAGAGSGSGRSVDPTTTAGTLVY